MKTIIPIKCVALIGALALFTSACKKDVAMLPADLTHKLSVNNAIADALIAQMGGVLREEWDNVEGNDISGIPLQSAPTISSQVTSLEGPLNTGYNYGARLRGYIYPPTDGAYTFWIAADDSGELWLSTDDSPSKKVKIASTDSWTDNHQWDRYSSQKSAAVTLQANHKYYIEILHKQGQGGGNLAVKWMLPDNTVETPIPGSRLSPYVIQTLPGTGTILREEWDNIAGNDISNIPLQTTPSVTNQIISLEGPLNIGYNYGARIRGYIYPPEDGNYTFWIAADDSGELWLSTDDDPAKKVKIAGTENWTDSRQWTRYSSQKSSQIALLANRKYYIEILHKQGQGGGNLAVQWTLPNNTTETPIPGSRLSPYIASGVIDTPAPIPAITGTGTILREEWGNVEGNDIVNIPLQNTPAKTAQATSFEGPLNPGNTYGERLRGYIFPPVDGNYTFWIASDDSGELWLSTDDDPAKKVKIASVTSWTDYRQWDKFPSQKSAPVSLQANHKYYIEALHKQGYGGGNLSVQWMLPNNSIEMPIPGTRLSPYVAPAVVVPVTPPVITPPSPGNYTVSNVISLTGAHDITISGKSIAGGNVPAITLTNCYNIHITQNRLVNSTDVGIHLYNCQNITIDYNYFTNVSTGVYAEQISGGGIVVNYNQFLNMKGPFPRGQFVQFNTVRGPGSSISYNKGENILGQSYAEDAINLYQSSGTPNSPTLIVGNWIRGGGPSASGGGIMLGDNGGSYLTAINNILVDPGEYGMAIAGGDHNSIINNKIYGRSQYFTNVGLYVNSIGGYNETNSTVTGNLINFYNANNYNNPWWLAPGVEKPTGWDDGGNVLGAQIDASILPAIIITGN